MEPIAIIGMACRYPEASTPTQLWHNVLSQRRAFRRIPSERLRSEDYFSSDRGAPDRSYAFQAAVIEGYEFDRVRFKISGTAFRSVDIAHWLALDIASQALSDAGFQEGAGLPCETTGVLIGNTLTGEISRANQMRLRWPYVARVLQTALANEGWDAQHRRTFLETLEESYKAPFAPITEETLAGGLSNTIAGRICNYFDLKGSGYTVDGACSSSLLAVAHACSALSLGELDVALAGGVDISLDPFELVGFAKVGALAENEMRVFDARSAGFIPGEGCGFVVLMRHSDAIARNSHIYALIRGWGLSSDGNGGITRPEVAGQLLALQRAYCKAAIGIDTVEYFEGHGTGTTVGDATELRSLSIARCEAGATVPAVIGSVKANIGHTKAAAGLAGLIKAVCALEAQILPPTTGSTAIHPELAGETPALRTLSTAEPWPADRDLRAGVSAMGFGGINVHVALEGVAAERLHDLGQRNRTIAASVQDCELFLFSGPDRDSLRRQVQAVAAVAPHLSLGELGDLAVHLAECLEPDEARAAVTASSPTELVSTLEKLNIHLTDAASDVFEGNIAFRADRSLGVRRIGFAFPGQGTPFSLDGGLFRRRFTEAQELYEQGAIPATGDQHSTAVAQPGIVGWSVAALRILHAMGVEAEVAVGHSLGELVALHWAGAFDEQTLFRIARSRGHLMAELAWPNGGMASLDAPSPEVSSLLQGSDVVISAINGPAATVISGSKTAVAGILESARTLGIRSLLLPVACAFHSPLMEPVTPALRDVLRGETFRALDRAVASTVTGGILEPLVNVEQLLCEQVTGAVRFTDAFRAANQRGVTLWVEVGPGQVLSKMLPELGAPHVVSVDAGGPSLRPLLEAMGVLFVHGAAVDLRRLFESRFVRPIDLDRPLKFIANPCEQAPAPLEPQPNSSPSRIPAEDSNEQIPSLPTERPLEIVRLLVAQRAELPATSVHDDHRLLSDLHLNSIAVGQIVVQAAKAMAATPPVDVMDYADASVGEIANALGKLKAADGSLEPEEFPAGLDSWLHAFTVDLVESPFPQHEKQIVGSGKVLAPPGHPLTETLGVAVANSTASGVFICLPPEPDDSLPGLLLEGAQAVLRGETAPCLVIVQSCAVGASFARSLYLESPNITTCVVRVPFDHPQACEWVLREAHAPQGYQEICYERDGRRLQPYLCAASLDDLCPASPGPERGDAALTRDDVLLVTGGGRGIAAECALTLAEAMGVRLLLLGRSKPNDSELTVNLKRLEAAGADFHYASADVSNPKSLRRAIEHGEAAMGPITAVLHAAGTNTPQPIRTLDLDACRRTLAPKVTGLQTLLSILDPNQLRLLITFGSIIARTGFQGEADYALANEWMTYLIEQWQTEHPQCRCLAIEWSAWSGVGMGAKIANLTTLRNQGISMIPPESGTKFLLRLLRSQLPRVAVVASSRFGRPPTLQLKPQIVPHLRFLEKTRVFCPQLEMVSDAHLSAETDPYLKDHELHQEQVLPAVMGLEQMVQAAMAVTGGQTHPVFERVEFARPIIVGRDGATVVRAVALAESRGRVQVALRTSDTGFAVDHFRAVCSFEDHQPATLFHDHHTGAPHLPLDPIRDLYGQILFQGPRFQCLSHYTELTASSCVAEIAPRQTDTWFARYLPGTFTLGHPGVRDAAIHAIQSCIPHRRVLPVAVHRIAIHSVEAPPPYTLRAVERVRDEDRFVYDLELRSADQTLCETWEGLHLRSVEPLPCPAAWPEPLFGPYVERCLHARWPDCGIRAVFNRSSTVNSDHAIRLITRNNSSPLRRRDGKPELSGIAVSSAHCDGATLAVAGPAALGCDAEIVENKPASVWRNLLGTPRFSLASVLAVEGAEDQDAAASRVWSALESLKKAGAPRDIPLLFSSVAKNGWLHLSAGPWAVATLVARLKSSRHRTALSVAFITPRTARSPFESYSDPAQSAFQT
jgi:enediyne polyketide synthase